MLMAGCHGTQSEEFSGLYARPAVSLTGHNAFECQGILNIQGDKMELSEVSLDLYALCTNLHFFVNESKVATLVL